MPSLEAKVARLERRLAALRAARSPEATWAAVFLHGGTPAQVGRACRPYRDELEGQLLAYGAEARRMAELGEAWPEAPLHRRPVQRFAELLAYPPGAEVPERLTTRVEPFYYGAGGWKKEYRFDPSGPPLGYDMYYRTWLYVELLRFISPNPAAARLRARLHDPAFSPAALAPPSTDRLESWPVGLFTVLAYGFQDAAWWSLLADTGAPPPPSFFDLPGKGDEEGPAAQDGKGPTATFGR